MLEGCNGLFAASNWSSASLSLPSAGPLPTPPGGACRPASGPGTPPYQQDVGGSQQEGQGDAGGVQGPQAGQQLEREGAPSHGCACEQVPHHMRVWPAPAQPLQGWHGPSLPLAHGRSSGRQHQCVPSRAAAQQASAPDRLESSGSGGTVETRGALHGWQGPRLPLPHGCLHGSQRQSVPSAAGMSIQVRWHSSSLTAWKR